MSESQSLTASRAEDDFDEEYATTASDGEDSDDGRKRRCRLASALLVGIASLAIAGVVISWVNWNGTESEVDVREMPVSESSAVPYGAALCDEGAGPFQFQHVSRSDPAARSAVSMLLQLAKKEVALCQPPVSKDLAPAAEAHKKGQDRFHTVAVAWKYASDCDSITYKITMLPNSTNGWQGQVNHEFGATRWKLLEDSFSPPLCSIQSDTSNGARRVSRTDPQVVESAEFAVGQINYLRSQCDPPASPPVSLSHVRQASQQVSQDLAYAMEIVITTEGSAAPLSEEMVACVTVFLRYTIGGEDVPPTKQLSLGIFGEYNYSVCSDPSTWGEVCGARNETLSTRLLGEVENEASDATNRWVTFKRFYLSEQGKAERKLQSVKPPITLRYISGGRYTNVPAEYQPRSDVTVADCYLNIPVYEQGDCGCCYGSAMAQMFSLRKCILARRASHEEQQAVNPDMTESVDCTDNPRWVSPNHYTCAWFAEDRTRCSTADVGQLSYCQHSCGTCPQAVRNTSALGTLQEFMYSTQDLATCACTNYVSSDSDVETNCFEHSGCNGGNMYGIWDAWLRLTDRKLRKRECMPLSIKCMASGGVTNPLSYSSCHSYEGLETWDKPCSCIESDLIPTELPACQREEDECTVLEQPDMVYKLMTFANSGISIPETVLNIQRHILEQGPVYTTFMCTDKFFDFFKGSGKNGNVFADHTGTVKGGHAVIFTGWGLTSEQYPSGVGADVTYWWLRNSWSETWGVAGYGKVITGENIMQIEENLASAMMEPTADDWTPPVCDVVRLRSLIATPVNPSEKDMLCWFQLNLQLSCSEEATLRVYWGNMEEADAAEEGVFVTPWFRCPGGDCWIEGFDLLFAEYGLNPAPLWITVSSFDELGNLRNSSVVLDIGAIDGISSVGRAQDCGAPELKCPDCVGEPWVYPDSSTVPPAPDWVSGSNTMPPEQNPYPDGEDRADQNDSPTPTFCFPPAALVQLPGAAQERPLSELRDGDLLASFGVDGGTVGSAEYMGDFHAGRDPTGAVEYLKIAHECQQQDRPLLITANHLVYKARPAPAKGEFVPAGDLRIGDALFALNCSEDGEAGSSAVLGISKVLVTGFAAPISSNGQLWVEQVLVSSYALLSDRHLDLWKRGPALIRENVQEICHALALPIRVAHRVARSSVSFLPEGSSLGWWPSTWPSDLSDKERGARRSYLHFLVALFDQVSVVLV